MSRDPSLTVTATPQFWEFGGGIWHHLDNRAGSGDVYFRAHQQPQAGADSNITGTEAELASMANVTKLAAGDSIDLDPGVFAVTIVRGSDASDVACRFGAGLSRATQALGTLLLSESFDHADLTDGGAATGTFTFTSNIPAGYVVRSVKAEVTEAFDSDDTSTCTMTIGDGSDVDRLSESGAVNFDLTSEATDAWTSSQLQGDPYVASEFQPVLTLTEDDDATDLISSANAQGKVTVTIRAERV
jgi:hypothetical protein